jgi:hypothetical protein
MKESSIQSVIHHSAAARDSIRLLGLPQKTAELWAAAMARSVSCAIRSERRSRSQVLDNVKELACRMQGGLESCKRVRLGRDSNTRGLRQQLCSIFFEAVPLTARAPSRINSADAYDLPASPQWTTRSRRPWVFGIYRYYRTFRTGSRRLPPGQDPPSFHRRKFLRSKNHELAAPRKRLLRRSARFRRVPNPVEACLISPSRRRRRR